METVIQHAKYGTVKYEEGFWTGKRTVTVGDVPLKKKDRKTWELEWEGVTVPATIKGNTMTGVTLTLGEEKITVLARPSWYVYAISLLTVLFVVIWGAVEKLVKIFPIFGGAIGGAISAVCAVFNIYFAGKVKKAWQKLLIGLAAFAVAVIATHVMAVLYLSAYEAL